MIQNAATRAPARNFLLKFDDETTARLNKMAAEAGCAVTHLIRRFVLDVLKDDAAMHGEGYTPESRRSMALAHCLWQRGFDTQEIAEETGLCESTVANALARAKGETE